MKWPGRRTETSESDTHARTLAADVEALLLPDPLRQLRGQGFSPQLRDRWLARSWPLNITLPATSLTDPEADLLLQLLRVRALRAGESTRARDRRLRMLAPEQQPPEERRLGDSFLKWLKQLNWTPTPGSANEYPELNTGLDTLGAILTGHPETRAAVIQAASPESETSGLLHALMEYNLTRRDSLGSQLTTRTGEQEVVREQMIICLPGGRWNSGQIIQKEAAHQQIHHLNSTYRAALSHNWRTQLWNDEDLIRSFGLLSLMILTGPLPTGMTHPSQESPGYWISHDNLHYRLGGGRTWRQTLEAPRSAQEGRTPSRAEQWTALLLGTDPEWKTEWDTQPASSATLGSLTVHSAHFPQNVSSFIIRSDLPDLLVATGIIQEAIQEIMNQTTTSESLRVLWSLTRSLQRAQAFQELAVRERNWLDNLIRQVGRQEPEARNST